MYCEPNACGIDNLAQKYNCIVVACKYRTSLEAPYLAAINDLHATYQWIVEQGQEFGADTDNIVLHGISSGGHLATALPFRLKRYGFSTKGVVVDRPITDERQIYPSSQSGGHLATALAFRLKRYGYSPKRIVAMVPQTDDREKDTKAGYIYGGWDAKVQHNALAQWLGNNFANSRLGPEALANHATVKQCIGYPPLFLHTLEWDPDREHCREFYGKVLEAQSYAEFHCWGGAHHGSAIWNGVILAGELNDYSARVKAVVDGNIEDLSMTSEDPG